MKRSAIWLGWLAILAPGAALAYPGQGIPNPRYPDGTGNDVIEQLNNAQLDQNYHGPLYYRGQQPPAAMPLYRPGAVAPPAYAAPNAGYPMPRPQS